MATSKEALAVKSLNSNPGRRNRRFVFKSFRDRIDETEINVFHSLNEVKENPSNSSFFLDCLIQWRELNTAEDFISLYEEIMPLTQTLPLVLVHKEMIISKLCSRLRMDARLSLEPILRLIADLSRDLLEDFMPFLPRITSSYLDLLNDGADKEPEILEQIFTSWSLIMMYLQKYLTRAIVLVLRYTMRLRYYPKDFVQEFMAEAVSFLLRNAPMEHLRKGIRKVMSEVARKPSKHRKYGVTAILWHIMRGTTSKFHSKAEQVLKMFLDGSLFVMGEKFNQGPDTITEVIISTFQRLCMDMKPEDLKLVWNCLYDGISYCLTNQNFSYLSRLLSVLVSTVSLENGRKVFGYSTLLACVDTLIETFMKSTKSGLKEDQLSEVVSQILQLMSCILDGLHSSCDMHMPTISIVSSKWAPAFQPSPSLLSFLKELVHKDPDTLFAFRNNFLSACKNLMKSSEDEVVYLIMTFCERLQPKEEGHALLDGIDNEVFVEISDFIRRKISCSIDKIRGLIDGDLSYAQLYETKLPFLWGVIRCYPLFVNTQQNESLLMELVDVVDQLLKAKSGISRQLWQCLIGTSSSSYHKLDAGDEIIFAHTSRILDLAGRYKSSSHVLCAVADFLDLIYGPTFQPNATCMMKHPMLESAKLRDALDVFAENLLNADKRIRVATLRILCHYEPLSDESLIPQQPESQSGAESWENTQADTRCNVLQLVLSIEETPVSVHNSRKLTQLVSRIQTGLSGGRVSKDYMPVVLNGIIGIFFNKFRDLSMSALECLAVFLEKYYSLVWERFVCILEEFLQQFLRTSDEDIEVTMDSSIVTQDIAELFHSHVNAKFGSKSCASILPFLLQALQKTPSVVEARSHQIIPLFLRFLGYKTTKTKDVDNPQGICSVGSFDPCVCKVEDWKAVLIEWLSLLEVLRNPRSLDHSQFLKDILVKGFLDENDPVVQLKVLDCLLNWKDDFLLSQSKHLKNLISSKTVREELTTWSLSNESDLIEDEHRSKLVPFVIRLLMPKIRNPKTLSSQKHTNKSGRRAILGYISLLDASELPLFYAMLMKPLQMIEQGSDVTTNWFWGALDITMDEFQSIDFFKFFTLKKTMVLPWKKKFAFLHVVEDVLGVFDEFRVRPFLNLLAGCVVRILHSCYVGLLRTRDDEYTPLESHSMVNTPAFEKNDEITSAKHLKDLRSLCLKIISIVLGKYEDHNFGSEFWGLFFESVKPLIDSFKQEGSSSEKPSSLFSCFLAMSQSQNLVSLLYRERNLVSDIFSILPVPSASEAVITYVLKFIDNLFSLDAVVGNENSDIRNVLLPNLEVLINNMHCLFNLKHGRKRSFVKHPGDIVLRILKSISKYVEDPISAKKFVDILLPLLRNIVKNSDVSTEALRILREVVPLLGCDTTTMILQSLAPLLVVAKLDTRMSVCDLIKALAQKDTSLLSTAELVCQLNATTSAMNRAELDFDVVISAYDKISVENNFFNRITAEHSLVILSHCIHDMASDELLLRHSAYRSLLAFVEFSALVIGQEREGRGTSGENMEVDYSFWTETCVRRIIDKFLLKYVGDALTGGWSIRKEWIDLLREMILRLPEIPDLKTLKALCSDDAEVDFFNNLTHLQMHRRARALMRFRDVARRGELSGVITERLFVPLFMSMLFDIKDKDEHLKRTCLDALASISGQMEWKSYYALLMRCFQDLTRRPEKQKVLLRLIISILNEFRFLDNATNGANDIADSFADHDGLEIELPVLAKCASSVTKSQLQTCLLKTVFPKLQKLLLSDSDKVNIDVSLAVLKVLKLLPSDVMDSHLPSIIQRIVNFLRNRLESIRDQARSALVECLKELGANYLTVVIKKLRATLKRGFELHVLGYTLYFVLIKGLHQSVGGELDHCLDDVLRVVGNDILGDVAEQKEVDKIASKMKEARKRMSFQTLELVAANVNFKINILKMLSPVMAYQEKHLTPKTKTKLDKMLKHIAAGIERNPSAIQVDIFFFVYDCIKKGVSQESRLCGSSSVTTASEQRHCVRLNKVSRVSYADVEPQGWHLITVFALQLFHNRLKNGKFEKNDNGVLQLLDPFVELLTTCMNSKYEEILSASLQCISHLIKLPLPELAVWGDKIKTILLDIAQSSSNPKSPVMETCVRLLTELLQGTEVTLSRDQLHILVHFPVFIDLGRNPSFVVLSLLKAIVCRKLVVPEIYDLAIEVSKLMITSQIGPIRKRCSQILLQFLLNYTLSENRRNQHIDFLINSLSYEHATGREAALEMLRVIIERFSQRLVDERSMSLFIELVKRLAHDADNQIRSLIAADIQLLVRRVSSNSLDTILECSRAWYMGENKQLWGVAAQVLGLIVEEKKVSQKQINRIFLQQGEDGENRMKSILQFAVKNGLEIDRSDQSVITEWKEAYYSLVLFQKIVVQFPVLFNEKHVEDFLNAIAKLLMHPHLWIRGISSRLVALYFKQISPEELGTAYLTKTDKLLRVAVSQCCQLKGQLSDVGSVEVLKSNIVFALKGIHAARTVNESRDPCVFWSTLDSCEQSSFLEASQQLDSSNRRIIIASVASSSYNDDHEEKDFCQLLVSSLLETLGKIALQSEDIKTKTVLSCFDLFASQIGLEDCQLYGNQLLLPLFRICEGFAGKAISDDVKQYAADVSKSIQKTMGAAKFLQEYNHIRSNLKFKRDTKKQKEKVMAVVDPVRNAKRKLRAAAKHRVNKKRKIMAMKFGRWMRQ